MMAFESAARRPVFLYRWFRVVARWLRAVAQGLRQVTGDDAYDRYLEHWHRHHADQNEIHEKPMSRREFFRQRENDRWNGVRRCC